MTTTPSPQPAYTYNQQMLAQIRALLAGKAMDDVARYKIGGRELDKVPWADLMKAEALYEARVRRELRRQNGLGMRYVPVIFGSAESRHSLTELAFYGVLSVATAILLAVAFRILMGGR